MYLGIDQSLLSSGVAVITATQETEYVGCIETKKLSGAPRLACIRNALLGVIGGTPGISFAALEGYSMASTHRALDLGELGGIVRLVLHDEGIPFVVVPPKSLKLFVTGSGDADKEAMRFATLKKWGVDFNQDDQCDAYGLAQVARSFHRNAGTTSSELEVLKKLRSVDRKLSLVAYPKSRLSL